MDIQVTSLLLLCAFLTLVNLSYHEHIVIRYACRTGDRGFIGRRQAVGVRRSKFRAFSTRGLTVTFFSACHQFRPRCEGIDGNDAISRKAYSDCTPS